MHTLSLTVHSFSSYLGFANYKLVSEHKPYIYIKIWKCSFFNIIYDLQAKAKQNGQKWLKLRNLIAP